MKKPFINWDEIAALTRPQMPKQEEKERQKGPKRGIGGWDNQAAFYNQMAKMEAGFTLNQINCFDTSPEDTVLDVGCGPGRITVPMAKRAKAVTALDASPEMLRFCRENAAEAGLNNVTTKLFDWEDDSALDTIEKHDIIIASRSVGMGDIAKLTSLAKKYAVIVIWSHGYPSIPVITGALFEGTEEKGQDGPKGFPMRRDRRLGNNLLYNRIYDMGYNPNLRIVEDGFTKTYGSREEAYEDLVKLRPEMKKDKLAIFQSNADKFLTENEDKTVTYLARTQSIVLWWKPEIEEE